LVDTQIRFDDGAAYERMMGNWSRRAGTIFLDWLRAPPGLKWIDVGCGNGSFTELIVDQCQPTEVEGIDPSGGQLSFARTRPAARLAKFGRGDAMSLPFSADSFDVATMALVIFFVPEPVRGVAEMTRVVRPGGLVAAYAWDMLGGGFPLEPIRAEMRAMGVSPLSPPSIEASRIEILRDLWTGAGLDAVETREITVQRSFADFDEFWTISVAGSSIGPIITAMSAADIDALKRRVRARLAPDATGGITCGARANAIKGHVSK